MEIFLTSIQSIVPIIVIIILGYFLQVRGWFQESFGNDLSKLIMNLAMPVAIFTSVLKYLTLDKLIKVSQGLQIPIEKRKNDKGRNRYKYITIQYLNGSKKEEYIENPNERVICNKEDILMTRTGNTGQVITNVEGVFHNNFFKMDYDRKIINKEFLIKYFENELIYKDIIRRATTSTIPDLSHSQFYKMSIDLPPIDLQNQFSEIVKQIDKQKFEIEKSLKETQELYESLMEKYFG